MKRASADCQTKRPKPGDSVFLVQFQAKNDTESRDYLPPPKRAPNPWDDSTVSRCTIHRIRLAKDSSGIVSFVLNRRRANAARWGAYVGVPYAPQRAALARRRFRTNETMPEESFARRIRWMVQRDTVESSHGFGARFGGGR